MRIVAWNCCGGPLERKRAALDTLEADLAVVSEGPRLEEADDAAVWAGVNPRKGVAVFARPPWKLSAIDPPADTPRTFVPVEVSGPEAFVLVGVWAESHGEDRYVRASHRALDLLAGLIRNRPTV